MSKPITILMGGHHTANRISPIWKYRHGRQTGVVIEEKGIEKDNEHWLMQRLIYQGMELLKKNVPERTIKENFILLPYRYNLIHKIDWINANASKYSTVIEFHGNSFNDPRVSGAETFYAKENTRRSRRTAEDISEIISGTLGIPNRGAKPDNLSQHERLGLMVNTKTLDDIVAELGFMTNERDYAKMLELGGEAVYQVLKYRLNRKT